MTDRNTYLGSVEIVALVEPEASPFCSAYSVWLEKTGLVERAEATERMKAGKYLERAVLEEWNRRNDRAFAFNDAPFFNDRLKTIGATPDGVDIHGLVREGAEVKTVTPEVREHWDNGTPRYIWWQAQHEMLCANLDRIVVIAQFGFHRLAHEWIARDREAGERIVIACNEMWRRINGELPPPEADAHPATTAALRRREVQAKAIELSRDAQHLTARLEAIERRQKELEKEATDIRNKIRAEMGDASVGVFPNGEGWAIRTIDASSYTVNRKAYQQMKRLKNREAVEGEEE